MALPSNERLSVEDLHRKFIEALNGGVASHSEIGTKPLEVDLKVPLPPRLRVYIYNATYPPGGRTMGEHKIQLIVPGQERGSSTADGSVPCALNRVVAERLAEHGQGGGAPTAGGTLPDPQRRSV